uniref:Uncharacterized protein n=1 Tax=Candidatus Methanogaster sp. ANME-2c ERB4 TaxID=2759911 RepID=A0A7G9YA50_9EURY|nr:hypothetical protein LIGEDEPM_00001 [Methanosarcinales archaeon ANME-2c ERB4]
MFSFGYVPESQDSADNSAFIIFDRCEAIIDRYLRSVLCYQRRLTGQLDNSTFPEYSCYRILDLFAGRPVYDLKDLCQGLSGSILLFPSGQSLSNMIHGLHITHPIGGDHSITDTHKGCCKPFFTLLQPFLDPALVKSRFDGCEELPLLKRLDKVSVWLCALGFIDQPDIRIRC